MLQGRLHERDDPLPETLVGFTDRGNVADAGERPQQIFQLGGVDIDTASDDDVGATPRDIHRPVFTDPPVTTSTETLLAGCAAYQSALCPGADCGRYRSAHRPVPATDTTSSPSRPTGSIFPCSSHVLTLKCGNSVPDAPGSQGISASQGRSH